MSVFRDSYENTRKALADEQEKKLRQQMEKERVAEANLQELLSALKDDVYLTSELGLIPERIDDEIVLLGCSVRFESGHWTIYSYDHGEHYASELSQCLAKLGEIMAKSHFDGE